MNAKNLAVELFQKYLELATTDGRSFRATILEELKAKTGCSHAAACTHYNNAKKAAPPVDGLGRVAVNSAIKKPGKKSKDDIVADNDCFSVMEIRDGVVGRYQSFILQGDASEKFDEKVEAWPRSEWVMIQGLGPNSGDTFKLEAGEKEVKRHTPVTETA